MAGKGGSTTVHETSSYDIYFQMWNNLKDDDGFLEYLASHALKYIAELNSTYFEPGQDLSLYAEDYFDRFPPDSYQPFMYDNIMLVGLAACKAESEGLDPTDGRDMRSVFNSIEFEGFSGQIKIGKSIISRYA